LPLLVVAQDVAGRLKQFQQAIPILKNEWNHYNKQAVNSINLLALNIYFLM
jgi:hypothetical protein